MTFVDLETMIGAPTVTPPAVDWLVLEHYIGLTLPGDYKGLFTKYADLEFDSFLYLPHPYLGEDVDQAKSIFAYTLGPLAEMNMGRNEITMLDNSGNRFEVDPYPIYPEPGGLFKWGDTVNGDYCLWSTMDPDPEKWTVVVTNSSLWWHFPGGFTEFLIGVMGGGVYCPLFPEMSPGAIPDVDQIEVV
ncbi:SMI1/KNR4 family protein [Actinomadura craniellae]|uniref:hypothetical protein n=1 Tax=Actinomadura craniellae TaxID=2231787 RepID=UPI0011BEBB03|nr:hypothetical protein [Actinomadura craniellae]